MSSPTEERLGENTWWFFRDPPHRFHLGSGLPSPPYHKFLVARRDMLDSSSFPAWSLISESRTVDELYTVTWWICEFPLCWASCDSKARLSYTFIHRTFPGLVFNNIHPNLSEKISHGRFGCLPGFCGGCFGICEERRYAYIQRPDANLGVISQTPRAILFCFVAWTSPNKLS